MPIIYDPPVLSELVKTKLTDGNYRDQPILQGYPAYSHCFVCFHPFLKIKQRSATSIEFNHAKRWPDKSEIIKHSERMSWNEVMKILGIQDYKVLDRALAFYHGAYRYADRSDFQKLWNLIEKDGSDIIPPQVDWLPEILENEICEKLMSMNYHELYIGEEAAENARLTSTKSILSNTQRLPGKVKIRTPDSKILIANDFDQRYTYFLSERPILDDMIHSLDLEGFFCDGSTPESWSWEEIPEADRFDPEKDS